MNDYSDTVRSIIDRENELLNHRVTWLTTLQGLLFTALAVGTNSEFLVKTLCGLGISFAIVSGLGIFASTRAVYKQYDWWVTNKPTSYKGPDVIGHTSYTDNEILKYCTPWFFIPIIIIIGWLSILCNLSLIVSK